MPMDEMPRFAHGGDVYRELPDGVTEWLDFSANINPRGILPEVRRAITDNIDGLIHYPDTEAARLRQAISSCYAVPYDSVLPCNGGAELLYLFAHVVRPRRVLLPVPSFNDYERAALAAGAEVVYEPLQESEAFRPDVERLRDAMTTADCLMLGNPNNPTGVLMTREQLLPLIDRAEETGTWLIMDESFLDFRPDSERYTVAGLVADHPHLLVLHSLTKFFALPGLRLGFGIAAPALMGRLLAGKDVWNVNSLAQVAGTAALELMAARPELRQEMQDSVRREALLLAMGLSELPGMKVYEPSVNFVFLNMNADVTVPHRTSGALTAALRQKGILVRDCANYPGLDGESYLRLAVTDSQKRMKLIFALEDTLREMEKL